MKTFLVVVTLALAATGCLGSDDEPGYPTPAGCAFPPEHVTCAEGVCSALYHCSHSLDVAIPAFSWCDLSVPEGYLCYWADPTVEVAP